MVPLPNALLGVLLGTAVGDSLGLPMEGLSAARQRRLFTPPLRQRLVGHYGMASDDTEHTFLVAQALFTAPGDAAAFQHALAWGLRNWLLGLPAGIGFATLRSIIKLWLGVPPSRSGVWSAGNGPAMRSALLGAVFHDRPDLLAAFVQASAQLTHRDPRAEVAARAVAECTRWMIRGGDVPALLDTLRVLDEQPEWTRLMTTLHTALAQDLHVTAFAQQIGVRRGVTGYAYQSVPVALYAAIRHRDDFVGGLTAAIECGGDTDTVGAMVGAMIGGRVGEEGIPAEWVSGIAEWPRSVSLLRQVAVQIAVQAATPQPLGPVSYFWPGLVPRNLLFLVIVLLHGFRRLLPPYG